MSSFDKYFESLSYSMAWNCSCEQHNENKNGPKKEILTYIFEMYICAQIPFI